MKVYRFPREYSRGFCFITVPLKNSKNTAFLSRCLKKGFQFIKKSVDYLEVLTKQSTFVLRLLVGVLYLVIPFFGAVSIASTCSPFFNPSFQNSLQVKNFLFVSFLHYKDTKISGNHKEKLYYFSRKYDLF